MQAALDLKQTNKQKPASGSSAPHQKGRREKERDAPTQLVGCKCIRPPQSPAGLRPAQAEEAHVPTHNPADLLPGTEMRCRKKQRGRCAMSAHERTDDWTASAVLGDCGRAGTPPSSMVTSRRCAGGAITKNYTCVIKCKNGGPAILGGGQVLFAFFGFFFLVAPHGLQDLSAPTGD